MEKTGPKSYGGYAWAEEYSFQAAPPHSSFPTTTTMT
jgi:hypothetical protein